MNKKQKEEYQMHIQWKICHRAQGTDNERSNCYIWNKATIHYINMNPITTCQLHCFYLDKMKNQTLNFAWKTKTKCLRNHEKKKKRFDWRVVTKIVGLPIEVSKHYENYNKLMQKKRKKKIKIGSNGYMIPAVQGKKDMEVAFVAA